MRFHSRSSIGSATLLTRPTMKRNMLRVSTHPNMVCGSTDHTSTQLSVRVIRYQHILKLVRTLLNYCVLGTSITAIFFKWSFSLCTYIHRINDMLDFISLGQVDLPGARRKRQNTNWNILAHSWTRTHKPEIWRLVFFQLSYAGPIRMSLNIFLIYYIY